MEKSKNGKAIVAMSGGLDSSVAAALLKRAGFNVAGVFMKITNLPQLRESEKRARKIAKFLKIPFLVLDLRKQFKKKIINYFLKENKRGNTPNPCVVCNKEIKFGLLLKKALELNAVFVATGHYALKREIKNQKSKIKNQKLLRAKDKNKDQSYFLWMLNQRQLKKILFPVGDYTRKEVENLAKKFKLPVLRAKKSVEICFIKNTIEDFLKKYLKGKNGDIVDTEENKIGKHSGLWFYTIGQRKGICLPRGPYYVFAKDLKKNILIVTKNKKYLDKKELIVKGVSWISGKASKLPLKVMAKIRYQHKPTSATIYSKKQATGDRRQAARYSIIFEKPQRAITPGQSVVFYKRKEVLGGGIIC